jgi:hypothetical protein
LNEFRLAQRAFLLILTILIAFSCKKDLNLVGLDLVSPEELLKLGYSDTVQITAYTVKEDSVKTANLSYALLGSMNDPIFGKTTADWYSQIRLATEPTQFGTSPVFDSAFLLLPYSGAYGDTLSNMTLRVYKLIDDIVDSVHKYSNNSVQYDDEIPLGEITFAPHPYDSAYFNGEKQLPYLRIQLNSAFGSQMVMSDTSDLASNAKFVKAFKGIAIISEPQQGVGQGAILRMAISSGSSRIDMYYHNATDTSTYSFGLNSDCLRFNHFDHDNYNGASPLLKQQLEGDTSLGTQFLFTQTMGGMRVKIKFPNLKNWFKDQKVIINDAQLVLTNSSTSTTFNPPSTLSLYPIADDGTLNPVALPDYSETITGFFGGSYNASAKTYTFRLTHYVQQVLTGVQDNNGLFLFIPLSSVTGGRLVLNGTGSPTSGMKLYLKYTIVN